MTKYVRGIVFFVCIFLLCPLSINAAQEAWNFQELHYTRCIVEPNYSRNVNCPPVTGNHVSAHWEHRVQINLRNSTFSPDSFVVIAECLEVGEDMDDDGTADPICTTGSSSLDKEIFCGDVNSPSAGCDHLAFLESLEDVEYSLDIDSDYGQFSVQNGNVIKMIPGKIVTDAQGKTIYQAVEWQSFTKLDATRSYLAIYPFIPPSITPSPSLPSQTKGLGGQQQDVMDTFPTSTPTPTPVPVRTSWDPRGRVFDAETLEPITQGNVVLKQKNELNVFDAGYANKQNPLILNPFQLENSGEYIFYVVNGEYTLEPRIPSYRHMTSSELNSLSSNAKKIYVNQLYFSDSLPIVEKGSIEFRDVPVMSVNGTHIEAPIKVYSEKREVSDTGDLLYSGQVSYPYAQLITEFCSEVNSKEVCHDKNIFSYLNGGPDNQGYFSISLKQQNMQAGEYIIRSFKKVDLRALPLAQKMRMVMHLAWTAILPKGVEAAEANPNRAAIEVIPLVLVGYLEDEHGAILANTEVEIHTVRVPTAIYATKTDSRGLLAISSEHLPREAYTIVAKKNGVETTIKTSTFLSNNKEFYEQHKLNPNIALTEDQISTVIKENNQASPSSLAKPAVVSDDNIASNSNSMIIVLIAAVLLLLVGVVSIVIYYRKFWNQPQE
ncbi:hypothetical protein KAZ66_00650 [Candidatus Woesebacteria bacterium]|nr:hypothetical protein [Candidatus Woesebacteria bacterium]